MFSLLPILFTLCAIGYSKSLELKSVENATIPIMKTIENVDLLYYEKSSKNVSGSIYLPFILLNENDVSPEKVTLEVNKAKNTIEIVENGKEPSRGSKLYLLKGIYSNHSISYQIRFAKLENAKTGEYKLCLTIKESLICASSYIFSSPIITKFTKPKLGLEGDPIRITCLFEAYPETTEIVWSLIKGDNFTTANKTVIRSNDHIEIKANPETPLLNDTLFIKSLTKNDSGIYMCTVISKGQEDNALVKINVKDRWAALYPFIGIVIEVVILVAAILVYEKYQVRSQNHRNKNYDENPDEGNNDHAIPLASGGGDEDNVAGEGGPPVVEVEAERANSLEVRQRDAVTRNV